MSHAAPTQAEAALIGARWMPAIAAPLRAVYQAGQRTDKRRQNVIAMTVFAICFDLFIAAQLRSAPELVPLSAILRLGVMTPCFAAFIWLDRTRSLGRMYDPLLLVLALMPIAITVILCLRTTSLTTLADIHATPMIVLSTGMIWRLEWRAAIANAVLSSAALIGEVIAVGSPVVPGAEIPSLILTDITVATTVIGFALQIESRDRRVFLLRTDERMRRETLAALNRGLLLQSQTDALTGLANRRCFDETLAATWIDSLKGGRGLSLIMIDVDHFKRYNDHYGHVGGDECLRRLAAGVRGALRAGDLFARYGGEEFAVILPDVKLPVAASIAEDIRQRVRELALPHGGMGKDARVSVSLGVAWSRPAAADGAGLLIEAADRQLYKAKTSGRDKVAWINHAAMPMGIPSDVVSP